MDCIEAQQIVSEATDRTPIDQDRLEAAKQHCMSCSDCSAFVHGLARLSTARPLEAPEGLADRIMDAVRAEAEAAAKRAEAASRALSGAASASGDVAPTTASQPMTDFTAPPPGPSPRRPRLSTLERAIAYSGFAALLLVAAGIAATVGSRYILGPQKNENTLMMSPQMDSASRTTAPADAAATGEALSGKMAAAQDASLPRLVVANGFAYRFTAELPSLTYSTTPSGTVLSSLDATGSPRLRTAHYTSEGALFIEKDGSFYQFSLVRRQFGGVTYALRSGNLQRFELWPVWASALASPVDDLGGPDFSLAGSDKYGTNVYAPVNTNADRGIAIPPAATGDDPIAGSPVWTYWTPLR